MISMASKLFKDIPGAPNDYEVHISQNHIEFIEKNLPNLEKIRLVHEISKLGDPRNRILLSFQDIVTVIDEHGLVDDHGFAEDLGILDVGKFESGGIMSELYNMDDWLDDYLQHDIAHCVGCAHCTRGDDSELFNQADLNFPPWRTICEVEKVNEQFLHIGLELNKSHPKWLEEHGDSA